ncbi:MAG: HAD hydrolase family protein [Spirochaeta sp.]|nr:HAD hydrolase family protein [Spirochaeta sp.]
MERFYLAAENERQAALTGLDTIKKRVLAEVPACRISSDQAYRISDLAIDFCEDVPPLNKRDISRICRILEEEKAEYKISSIHINCWFGDFDKVKGVNAYLKRTRGRDISQLEDRMLFTGDSPNDEPLFEELEHSIGMANITPFLKDICHPPRYIILEKTKFPKRCLDFLPAIRVKMHNHRTVHKTQPLKKRCQF